MQVTNDNLNIGLKFQMAPSFFLSLSLSLSLSLLSLLSLSSAESCESPNIHSLSPLSLSLSRFLTNERDEYVISEEEREFFFNHGEKSQTHTHIHTHTHTSAPTVISSFPHQLQQPSLPFNEALSRSLVQCLHPDLMYLFTHAEFV